MSEDEHGAEQRPQGTGQGEAQPCVNWLDGCYHSSSLGAPEEGERTSTGNWDSVCSWQKPLKQQEEILGLG